MSRRGEQWIEFSREVFAHVEKYTVPQYGDMPNDLASRFSAADIKASIDRYVCRIGTNRRGVGEAKRDALKIAHYACMLYACLLEEEDAT